MPLVSMKRTKSMTSKESPILGGGAEPEEDQFPWGLCIALEEEELDKLKAGFKIGESISLIAVAKVTSVSEEAEPEPNRSVTLQITSLGVGEDIANDKGKASIIYPKLGGE